LTRIASEADLEQICNMMQQKLDERGYTSILYPDGGDKEALLRFELKAELRSAMSDATKFVVVSESKFPGTEVSAKLFLIHDDVVDICKGTILASATWQRAGKDDYAMSLYEANTSQEAKSLHEAKTLEEANKLAEAKIFVQGKMKGFREGGSIRH